MGFLVYSDASFTTLLTLAHLWGGKNTPGS